MQGQDLKNALGRGLFLASFFLGSSAFAQAAPPEPAAQPQPSPPTGGSQWMPPAAPAEAPPSAASDPGNPATGTPTAEPPNPEPQPKIQLATQAPAPPPVEVRSDKIHDGFYARLSFGFGSQSTTLDDGSPAPNFEATAGALVIHVLVGGAPAPGIVIGGSLGLDSLPSTTFDAADGYQLKTGLNLVSIGPFIDGYPDSRGGFHLGGTVGPTFAKLTTGTGMPDNSAAGIGLAAWLGFDWWVADQWSVGGLLRFSGANNWSGDSPSLGADMRSISLLATAVYQ